MNVAVLTLTRDRLAYTQHCFQTLERNSGCDYRHFVLDQGSTDGTAEWLSEQDNLDVVALPANIGLCPGLNRLLRCFSLDLFDVIVRFDNDCEVLQPDTLRTVCQVAVEYDAIVAPHVNGLNNPPRIVGTATAGSHTINETEILGGIFMAVPARLFSDLGFRYDERMPPWAGDEQIVPWWRAQGGCAGYLDGWQVNHYLTTEGQKQDDAGYQARKEREMAV